MMRRRFINTGNVIDINNYLTIVALEDDLTVETISSNPNESLYYSIDGGEWTYIRVNREMPRINKGHYILLKRTLSDGNMNYITIMADKLFNLTGNCNSMIFGDNAADKFDLTGYDECYHSMFYGCPVVEVSPTFLPATTLAYNCYCDMFQECTSLITTPELPATTLAKRCYDGMFYGCTSLTTAPELPTTALSNGCYRNMFRNCTSLTTAPELPATTLKDSCYNYMFNGCSKLNYIKAMFTTDPLTTDGLGYHAYTNNWVSGVASSGTFVKNKNATWNATGASSIPSGWTVQTA